MVDYSPFPHIYNYARTVLYTDDRFLFVQNGIGIISQFSDMEHDFGLVPNPKYNEEQEKYNHLTDTNSLLFGIPKSAGDLEMVGAVMEYSAWLSNGTLVPAYYEINIKDKKMRDDIAYEMLDIIKSSFCYEVSDIYGLGVSSVVQNAYKNGGNIASAYASLESSINQILEFVINLMMFEH